MDVAGSARGPRSPRNQNPIPSSNSLQSYPGSHTPALVSPQTFFLLVPPTSMAHPRSSDPFPLHTCPPGFRLFHTHSSRSPQIQSNCVFVLSIFLVPRMLHSAAITSIGGNTAFSYPFCYLNLPRIRGRKLYGFLSCSSVQQGPNKMVGVGSRGNDIKRSSLFLTKHEVILLLSSSLNPRML